MNDNHTPWFQDRLEKAREENFWVIANTQEHGENDE